MLGLASRFPGYLRRRDGRFKSFPLGRNSAPTAAFTKLNYVLFPAIILKEDAR
jgi:hypothetical protein